MSFMKKLAGNNLPIVGSQDRCRCQYTNGMMRCKYPGNIALGAVVGSQEDMDSRRWLCIHHAFCNNSADGARITEESQSFVGVNREEDERIFDEEVRQSLKRFGLERKMSESAHDHAMRCRKWCLDNVRSIGANTPNKDWAKRLLKKHYAGEVLTQGQLSYACEALNLDPKQVKARQPVNEIQQRAPGCDDE